MTTPARLGRQAQAAAGGESCPFGEEPCRQSGRHSHPYTVGQWGTRKCSCGCRRYKVTWSRQIGVLVSCENCAKRNYPATCYEAGRLAGPRIRGGTDEVPPY